MFQLKNFLFSCCTLQHVNQDTEANLGGGGLAKSSGHTSHAGAKITEADIARGNKLRMVSIEGTLIPVNTEFLINPGGLINSARAKTDGETYIGYSKVKKSDNQIMNDIVLADSSVGDQHCVIKYASEKKKYFLQDLGEGSGTFIKIEKELELKSGYIVSFSDSHMLISIQDLNPNAAGGAEDDVKGDLTIKFLDGPKIDEVFRFTSETKVIKIGRMNDCEIKFDDNNLSRYQCTFKYLNNNWYVVDGFRNKPSTNGTWLLVDHNLELTHEMIVKIGQTLFRMEVVPV